MALQRIEVPAARRVEEWEARLSKIARNLTDFNDSDEARRVTARLRDPDRAYGGKTLAEASRAATALEGLWRDYLTLSAVVERAVGASRKIALPWSRDAEVAAILEGPSVRLPTISVPVARRDLLDSPETDAMATPGAVLASMKDAFAIARDAITRIAAAEAGVAGRIATLRAGLEDLSAWSARTKIDLGNDPCLALALAEADSDPLSALEAAAKAEVSLLDLEARRVKADAALARLVSGFAAADATLVVLRQLCSKTAEARREAEAIEGARDRSPVQDEAAGLSDWLETLRGTAAEGKPGPTTIGLAKWTEAAAAAKIRAEATLREVLAPVQALADLKGRFRALRAKQAVVRSPEAAAIEPETKAELSRVPARLDEARRLVAAYEAMLLRPVARDILDGGRG